MRGYAVLLLVHLAAAGCATPGDDAKSSPPPATPRADADPAPPATHDATTGSPTADDIADIARRFRELTRMTDAPSMVSMDLLFDCASPTPQRTQAVREKHGPHTS